MGEKKFLKKINLSFKFGLSLGIIALTVFIFGGYFIYREIMKDVRGSLKRELITLAQVSSASIDVASHETIVSPADESSAIYERLVAPLHKIQAATLLVNSIYTLRLSGQGGVGIFVLDSTIPEDSNRNGVIDPEEDRAHVGEEYILSEYPAMLAAFSGTVGADEDIACDKWGCFLSAYAPLKNIQGQIVGIVGVDMSAESVTDVERELKDLMPVILLFFVLLIVFIFMLVKIFFIEPLLVLEKGIENFSKDLDSRVELETGDEFEKIANQFNEMAGEVAASHRGLEIQIAKRTKDLNTANKELSKNNLKLQELNQMRKNFVSYTAHELKNPLNVFRWSLEMLRNEDLGKINLKQREIVEQLYTSNDRLLSLVNDLLDVSRLDEARLKVQPAPCQIEDIVDEAAGNSAVSIKSQDIDFVWNKPSPAMPKVLADKDRILQVVLNLLSNAVKFTPSGKKIEITVSAANRVAPEEIIPRYGFTGKGGKYIQVKIADEGLGIPEGEQEKIFSRFFRGSNVKRANIEGTGLGMFITFEIIKIHGGAIWFESEENKGTAFYFTLPVA